MDTVVPQFSEREQLIRFPPKFPIHFRMAASVFEDGEYRLISTPEPDLEEKVNLELEHGELKLDPDQCYRIQDLVHILSLLHHVRLSPEKEESELLPTRVTSKAKFGVHTISIRHPDKPVSDDPEIVEDVHSDSE